MKQQSGIFLDSDVVISSLLSKSGAASLLVNNTKTYLALFISDVSYEELQIVVQRLNLDKLSLTKLIDSKFKIVKLKSPLKKIKQQYQDYVIDINDAHVVAGAVAAEVNYLISYNIKDYKVDKIKVDFNLLVLTPAMFLQYLRSR